MPDEIEVPLEHLHEQIAEAHAHARGGKSEENSEQSGDEKKHEGWTQLIAVSTAILAVVAAVGSLRAGLLVNEALLSKNDEISRGPRPPISGTTTSPKASKGSCMLQPPSFCPQARR